MRLPLLYSALCLSAVVAVVPGDSPSATLFAGESPNTDTLTASDLERAARDFRIQVYKTFRQNRAEFDRRNAAWQQLQHEWQAAGRKSEEIAPLVAWLEKATRESRSASAGPLPPSPHAAPPVAKRTSPPPRATMEPTPSRAPIVQGPDVVRRAEPAPTKRPTPPANARPATTRGEGGPASTAAAAIPEPPPLPRAAISAPPTERHADSDSLPSVPLTIRSTTSEIGQSRSGASVPSAADALALETMRLRRPAPAASIETPSSPHADPDPAPRPNAYSASDQAGDTTSDSAGVDVNEVAVRIAGHNLAIATLEEEISAATDASIAALDVFVERLEQLSTRRTDLAPYYTLVPESDRHRLRPLASADKSVELLRMRIAAVREAVEAQTSLPAYTSQQTLDELAKLAGRVEALTKAKP